MKIYSTLNIGEFHQLHCEDYFIFEAIGNNEQLIAVADGCTMGRDSVFAAILTGKILRKIAKQLYYTGGLSQDVQTLAEKLKMVVSELFQELKFQKNHLGLEINEVLSTLVLGIVDTDVMRGEFLIIGDGLIYIDGTAYEYEQADKPDYLAYHLNENFDNWFNNQKQLLSIRAFNDLSICTDGIFTFKNLGNEKHQLSESFIIEYLLKDKTNYEYKNFLDQKIRELKQKYNHVVTDDLAIIRLIS